jgi:DNA-binding PadR family transcriptional regulator
MKDLTNFQRDLLIVASGLNRPKGVDIRDELERYYETEVNSGRLYPNLDTLVEKSLLDKGSHDRRTNNYTLTDRGEQEIKTHLKWGLSYIPSKLKSQIEPLPKK